MNEGLPRCRNSESVVDGTASFGGEAVLGDIDSLCGDEGDGGETEMSQETNHLPRYEDRNISKNMMAFAGLFKNNGQVMDPLGEDTTIQNGYTEKTVTQLLRTRTEDNRVPMNLLPYKKKDINDDYCRKLYAYRHMFSKVPGVGTVWKTKEDVSNYKLELVSIYEKLLKEGRRLYENKIVEIARQLGILRMDKQPCVSWKEVEQWGVHPNNHENQVVQRETISKLIDLSQGRVSRDDGYQIGLKYY